MNRLDARTAAPLAAALALSACGGPVAQVDPAPLGALVHEAQPAHIVTLEGRQWIAVGEQLRPVVPWDGPPDSACEEAPVIEDDRPDRPGVWFAPEGPALLVLDEYATVWGVDPEERCPVAWEPLEEPDPVAALPDEGTVVLNLADSAVYTSGVDGHLDVLPLPGLESVYFGYDSVSVESEDGATIFSQPVAVQLIGDTGIYNVGLRVHADGSGGFTAQLESSASTFSEEDGSNESESAYETLVWRPGMEEAVVVASLRTYNGDLGDHEGDVHTSSKEVTRAAWLVPGGLISVERENLDSTDNESGWSESGEQCWTETHASSASTVWRFESPTESVELWSLGRSDQEVDGDCPEDGVDPTADPEGDEPLDGEEPEE